MASARKKSAPSKAPRKSKPAPKAKAAKAKPAGKPAKAKAKPVAKKPLPAKLAKPAARHAVPKAAVAKSAGARGVVAKGAAAKSAPHKGGKAIAAPVKAAAHKGGKPVAAPVKGAAVKGGKPVVPAKGAALKGAKPVPPPPPVKAKPPRLVPATAEARAAAALAARASKPGAKGRGANRPEPEVRPLGVLPLSAQAKPRVALPPRPAAPARSFTPPRGTPRQQQTVRKGDDRLTQDDLKYFEERLLVERRRIMGEMGHLESTVLKVNPRDAAGELSGYSYHMADAGTDSMEREKAFDIASKEGRLLLEIDEALRRLYNGTFGICEISGKPISRTRLEALPWARLSIEEQEKLEKEKRLGRMVATDKE